MRKILLTSSGLGMEDAQRVMRLFGVDPAQTIVGFIATAADENPSYVQQERLQLGAFGFQTLVDVDLKQPDDLEKLNDCQIIFVGGGNAFYLLKWIRQSGFDQKLKQLLSDEKIYIGVSAGSVVLGTSIEIASIGTGADVNKVGLQDLRGLRHVPFMVAPHMTEAEVPLYDAFARKAALRPIVGLEDGQAILCIGDRYKLLGPGKPHTWNSKLFR